jgi:hypothetical protein
VALESTIYTHGALGDDLGLEDVVRQHGGVPAVIGILDGVPTVGLTPKEVQRIVHDGGAMKVSRRDIAYLVGMVSGEFDLHTTIPAIVFICFVTINAHMAFGFLFMLNDTSNAPESYHSSFRIGHDRSQTPRGHHNRGDHDPREASRYSRVWHWRTGRCPSGGA